MLARVLPITLSVKAIKCQAAVTVITWLLCVTKRDFGPRDQGHQQRGLASIDRQINNRMKGNHAKERLLVPEQRQRVKSRCNQSDLTNLISTLNFMGPSPFHVWLGTTPSHDRTNFHSNYGQERIKAQRIPQAKGMLSVS